MKTKIALTIVALATCAAAMAQNQSAPGTTTGGSTGAGLGNGVNVGGQTGPAVPSAINPADGRVNRDTARGNQAAARRAAQAPQGQFDTSVGSSGVDQSARAGGTPDASREALMNNRARDENQYNKGGDATTGTPGDSGSTANDRAIAEPSHTPAGTAPAAGASKGN